MVVSMLRRDRATKRADIGYVDCEIWKSGIIKRFACQAWKTRQFNHMYRKKKKKKIRKATRYAKYVLFDLLQAVIFKEHIRQRTPASAHTRENF